jgi:hypothetical protein
MEPPRKENFNCAGRFRLIIVLAVWIIGIPLSIGQ